MLVQQLANGVMLGSTYALVAIGYTLIFGVLRLSASGARRSVHGGCIRWPSARAAVACRPGAGVDWWPGGGRLHRHRHRAGGVSADPATWQFTSSADREHDRRGLGASGGHDQDLWRRADRVSIESAIARSITSAFLTVTGPQIFILVTRGCCHDRVAPVRHAYPLRNGDARDVGEHPGRQPTRHQCRLRFVW